MTASVPLSKAKKRILYVEGHEDSREMLTVLLESDGYEVASAATVTDGLSLTRLERFDLFILDSRFRDGDGVDLCRQIRAFDPDTPIMFYSSAAYESDIKAGLDAGAQHYLIKPNGISGIEQTIAVLLASPLQSRAYISRRKRINSSEIDKGDVEEGRIESGSRTRDSEVRGGVGAAAGAVTGGIAGGGKVPS